MRCYGFSIDLWRAPTRPNTLGDVKDNTGETRLINVDFLVVRDFPQLAILPTSAHALRTSWSWTCVYLTSANWSGRLQVNAPPKRGTVVYSVLMLVACHGRAQVVCFSWGAREILW